MKITMLGVLGLIAIAALLVYAGYELRGMEQKPQSSPNPTLPPNS